mmetsp:Transcript_31581/g.76396  ORF Transcript_31581/g.76396 Transcript_31581/m.76396 type:complete len:458 (+) Transcript_31581:586-1959(+)
MSPTNQPPGCIVIITRFVPRCVPAAKVILVGAAHELLVGIVHVRSPQYLGIPPFVGAVEVAFCVWLEERVVDTIVLGEIDVVGIRELGAVVPLPARVVSDDGLGRRRTRRERSVRPGRQRRARAGNRIGLHRILLLIRGESLLLRHLIRGTRCLLLRLLIAHPPSSSSAALLHLLDGLLHVLHDIVQIVPQRVVDSLGHGSARARSHHDGRRIRARIPTTRVAAAAPAVGTARHPAKAAVGEVIAALLHPAGGTGYADAGGVGGARAAKVIAGIVGRGLLGLLLLLLLGGSEVGPRRGGRLRLQRGRPRRRLLNDRLGRHGHACVIASRGRGGGRCGIHQFRILALHPRGPIAYPPLAESAGIKQPIAARHPRPDDAVGTVDILGTRRADLEGESRVRFLGGDGLAAIVDLLEAFGIVCGGKGAGGEEEGREEEGRDGPRPSSSVSLVMVHIDLRLV